MIHREAVGVRCGCWTLIRSGAKNSSDETGKSQQEGKRRLDAASLSRSLSRPQLCH